MPISRGEDWGEPGTLAEDALVVGSDAALIEAVHEDLEDGRVAEVGLLGGDLHRTLGSPRHDSDDLRAGRGTRVVIDLARVELVRHDGTLSTAWFCAHLVAFERTSRLFASRTVVVMNAAFRGADNLGPRAHPNDGLLDVTDGRLPLWDRLRASGRTRSGTHVPHPDLATSRVRSLEVGFDEPATLFLDDRDLGPFKSISVRCIPDAVTVVV